MESQYIYCSNGISWGLFSDERIAPHYNSAKHVAAVLRCVRFTFEIIFGSDTVNEHPVLSVFAATNNVQTIREHMLIFLSANDRTFMQHIYQFSHELCHFMVPEKVCENYRWLEETLCQMMSWYAMEQIYLYRFEQFVPQLVSSYSLMPGYIVESQGKRMQIGDMPLSAFIHKNLRHLQKNCYDRDMNSAIGYELYQLFQEKSELWKIVPLLHTLNDNMALPDALDCLCRSLNAEEHGCDQLIKRLLE